MNQGLTLASKGDVAIDVVRFFWLVTSRHLPEWIRLPLLAAGVTFVVHEGLGWLRTRFGEQLEADPSVQESDSPVR
ncbi:hypothetical protein PUR59_06375 [Streptomyces sp. SP18ES09]|uniref:hypothetical protein n=1 Tax=Streptomyces sp. SP18ES09 TaxID=3002532 RepID=UPI002E769279|nr:hypothetical protein [Streptomyces sp. SP18ES09]MEE1814646.1 hypothetical protein [Streptomyces sp. SP18ES09]